MRRREIECALVRRRGRRERERERERGRERGDACCVVCVCAPPCLFLTRCAVASRVLFFCFLRFVGRLMLVQLRIYLRLLPSIDSYISHFLFSLIGYASLCILRERVVTFIYVLQKPETKWRHFYFTSDLRKLQPTHGSNFTMHIEPFSPLWFATDRTPS